MKIKLLHNGGYRGFVNAVFPVILDLDDGEYSKYYGYGFDIKMSAIPYYMPSRGVGGDFDDDYAGDSSGDSLYFSLVTKECEVIE